MLTEEQLRTLRTCLDTERTRLLENADKALGLTMNRDRESIGRDSMDESTEESMLGTQLRLHDREKFLLGKIDAALVRLDEGEIDECDDCGDTISFERLKARPVTTMCIECKEEREQKEQ